MLARTWRGFTRAQDAEAYADFLRGIGFGYPDAPGYYGVLALRRVNGGRAEFLLVSLWESEAAIEAFAGHDISKAVFYPEDEHFLVERDDRVHHYDVIFQSIAAER